MDSSLSVLILKWQGCLWMGQKGIDRFAEMSKGKGKDIDKDMKLGCSEPQ